MDERKTSLKNKTTASARQIKTRVINKEFKHRLKTYHFSQHTKPNTMDKNKY